MTKDLLNQSIIFSRRRLLTRSVAKHTCISLILSIPIDQSQAAQENWKDYKIWPKKVRHSIFLKYKSCMELIGLHSSAKHAYLTWLNLSSIRWLAHNTRFHTLRALLNTCTKATNWSKQPLELGEKIQGKKNNKKRMQKRSTSISHFLPSVNLKPASQQHYGFTLSCKPSEQCCSLDLSSTNTS